MGDATRHEAIVTAALRRLGRAPAGGALDLRLLAGGGSGSAVYRLDLAGEEVVLKLTPPSRNRSLLARARREALFYRDLAPRVPVAVPRLLGFDVDEAAGVAVLLAAYAPSPPPDDWTEQAYTEVARQLGEFHATFWGKTAAPGMPRWLRAGPPVTRARCRAAASAWRALAERDDLRESLAPYRHRLAGHLSAIPALDPRMASSPATLCHGDCHAGNLLRGPAGEWIWADWQEVRLGSGVDDLAFFWQRAFVAAEASPPLEAMVAAYGVGWDDAGGPPMIRDGLDGDLARAELRSWLVDWPGYLGALSAARLERVLGRIGTLMDDVDIVGNP